MKIHQAFQQWRENSRIFRFYFRKYWQFYTIGIVSLVVVDGLEAVPPLLLKSAIDALGSHSFGGELGRTILILAGIYLGVAIVQAAMRFLWRKYIVRTSMFASHDMRIELFEHLTVMSPTFFQKRRVGELVSLSTNDIEAIRFALGPGALTIFDACFYFLVIPPIMFWISPKLTLIAFVPLLVVPFFVRRMEARIQARYRDVQDRFSILAASCQEALSGVRIVKGSALENFKERELERLGQSYAQANVAAARTQSSLTAGLESILSFSTTLLFLIGGAYVMGEQISLGVFVAFQRYVQKLQWPMEAFGLAANIFQRSLASQERVQEVLNQQPAPSAPPRARKTSAIPEIEIRGLEFRYGDGAPVLSDVQLKIPAGKRVGIAGGIGSGKSTLLQCLARTVSVPAGKIFFDGEDVTQIPMSETRGRIAFVPQETFLFSRTVEENVLYGSSFFDHPDEPVRLSAAKASTSLASVHEEIGRLPNGYGTMLGERGTNLSGGQRQRLSIARAIARKPQVLLLDDCMSAIDTETEAKLVDGILRASEGITLVMASHRVSSFLHLDWLVLLENGRVTAQGKPQDLIETQTLLRELHRREELAEMDLLQ